MPAGHNCYWVKTLLSGKKISAWETLWFSVVPTPCSEFLKKGIFLCFSFGCCYTFLFIFFP